MAWIEANKSYIANYQSKNFLYTKVATVDSGNFFLNDPSFVNLDIDKALLLERVSRVNLLLKDSQINPESLNTVRDKIIKDFGLKLVSGGSKEPNDNVNPSSKTLYDQLTPAQKQYLYDLNDIDTELYSTDTLFWNNGK